MTICYNRLEFLSFELISTILSSRVFVARSGTAFFMFSETIVPVLRQKGVEMLKFKGLSYIIILLTLVVTLFNLGGMISDSFFYDLKDLPTGEFLFPTMSPDGKKTVRIYKVEINSLGTAIRGELVWVDEKNITNTKNIYWQTGKTSAMVAWQNENTVLIDDHFISVFGEGYDSRKQIELPEASTKNRILKEVK